MATSDHDLPAGPRPAPNEPAEGGDGDEPVTPAPPHPEEPAEGDPSTT